MIFCIKKNPITFSREESDDREQSSADYLRTGSVWNISILL